MTKPFLVEEVERSVYCVPTLEEKIAENDPNFTVGHRRLIEFLLSRLPAGWVVYIEPHVRGFRPDVVVYHPRRGAVVMEVKDLDLSLLDRREGRLVGRTRSDPVYRSRTDALQQVERVLETLREGPLADLYDKQRGINGALTGLVYVHTASKSEQAKRLFPPVREGASIIEVCGNDDLEMGRLNRFVPCYNSDWIARNEVWALPSLQRLRRDLDPPRYLADYRQPVVLKGDQKNKAKPIWDDTRRKGSGTAYRRIRGAAGAGKTEVLATRAAAALKAGKRILVVSFHITMVNDLHDRVQRASQGQAKRATIRHFHGFVHDQQIEAGDPASGNAGLRADHPEAILERLLKPGHGGDPDYCFQKYDAIYVDEAQDFAPTWINALANCLGEGGELVLFADHRQNIHNADGGRVRQYKDFKFDGEWAKLDSPSFRLPKRLAEYLNSYVIRHPIGDEEDEAVMVVDQDTLAFGGMEWKDYPSLESLLADVPGALFRVRELSRAAHGGDDPHDNDIVFLCQNKEIGRRVLGRLPSATKANVAHVFGSLGDAENRARQELERSLGETKAAFEKRVKSMANGIDRPLQKRQKLAFRMGAGKLKACTIHSFKGWELGNVVLVWTQDATNSAEGPANTIREALFYTALSRAKQNVIVLNCDPAMYGEHDEWDAFDPKATP